MIFGIPVTGTTMIVFGVSLFALILFQVLVGLRWIKLGRHRMKWHKWTGITILGLAAFHGLLGTLFVTGWQFL